jgi:TatD related DNase
VTRIDLRNDELPSLDSDLAGCSDTRTLDYPSECNTGAPHSYCDLAVVSIGIKTDPIGLLCQNIPQSNLGPTRSAHPAAGVPILHWYSGGQRDLQRAIDEGCWFSVGPAMLLGEKGRKLVGSMPRDRILTEPDGPFATLNGRSALPWDVRTAVEMLAELWKIAVEDVDSLLDENLRKLGRYVSASKGSL